MALLSSSCTVLVFHRMLTSSRVVTHPFGMTLSLVTRLVHMAGRDALLYCYFRTLTVELHFKFPGLFFFFNEVTVMTERTQGFTSFTKQSVLAHTKVLFHPFA